MIISKIEVENCLSFKKMSIPEVGTFSDVNWFVGKNDSGKSNLLKILDIIFNGYKSEYIRDYVENNNDVYNFTMNALGKTLIHGNIVGVGKITVYYSNFSKVEMDNIKDYFYSIINKPEIKPSYKDISIEYIIKYETETEGTFLINNIKLGSLTDNDWLEKFSLSSDNSRNILKITTIINNSKYKVIPAIREIKPEIEKTIDKNFNPSLNGEGLSILLSEYQNKPAHGKRSFLREYVSTLSKFTDVHNISSATNQNMKDLEYDEIPQRFVGDATKQLTVLHFFFKHLDSKILGIEEPEGHLHPERQKVLLNFLNTYSKEKNIQLFITTHSPFFIDNSNINNI